MTDEIRIDPRGIDSEAFTQIGITSKLLPIKERKAPKNSDPQKKTKKANPSKQDDADSFGHELEDNPNIGTDWASS